ncbi:MAG: D-2-hydroxyacid dehydrogenase [Gemmatimonadota bacterium]|nr:D-2-hydroxyacid dehydrogenase [Gemmatimonadota bacterium]
MATLVIDLMDRRPIWALPDRSRAAILAAVPADWTVRFMETPADGSGDGVQRAPPELLEAVADARVYMGYGIPPEVLTSAPGLEWVHSGAAGVGSSLGAEMLERDVLFTNSAGIHAAPMAETALGMMLHFARGLDVAVRAQREGRWSAPEYWAADAPVTELGGSTVGIVGYGGIGRAVAARVAALGGRVVAVRRRGGVGGGRLVGRRRLVGAGAVGAEGDAMAARAAEVVAGSAGLDRVIAEADFLVLAVPETPLTRGLMTRGRLFAMKPGSVLINVARGRLVDETALLDALDSGLLRGAGLDVFQTEPLPPGHPFYAHPAVLMTPHVSATTRRFWGRETDLITDNIGRFLRGEPLRNLVDKAAGY